jgi:hypothetical protein
VASTALAFGTLLILLGVVGYVATGMVSVTALIPAAFGLLLALLGLLARQEALRKHAMHAAAALALVGFLATVSVFAGPLPALLAGGDVARPAAVISRAVMAILMLVFLVLCIKSFRDARLARKS